MDDHGHGHSHTHSPEDYQRMINRMSRIVGHANAIKSMMEEQRDCTEILVQISAVQAALNNLGKLMLKDHIDQCIVHAIDGSTGEEEKKRVLNSLNEAIEKFIR